MSGPERTETAHQPDETVVQAVRCSKCSTVVYSRAHHDWRACPCGAVFIDGGREYCRVGGAPVDYTMLRLAVPASVQDLFLDWNFNRDVYGIIRPEAIGSLVQRDDGAIEIGLLTT